MHESWAQQHWQAALEAAVQLVAGSLPRPGYPEHTRAGSLAGLPNHLDAHKGHVTLVPPLQPSVTFSICGKIVCCHQYNIRVAWFMKV